MKYIIYTALLSAVTLPAAYGQKVHQGERPDTLRRELTIVNDQTVEMDRTDPMPTTYRDLVPRLKPFRPEYNKKTLESRVKSSASSLNDLPRDLMQEKQGPGLGYVSVGLGHTLNQEIDAGIRLIHTDVDLLGLFLSYHGIKSSFDTGNYEGDYKNRQLLAGLRFERNMNPVSLSVGVDYTNSFFNHYGRMNNGIPAPSDTPSIMDNTTHNFHAFFGAESESLKTKIDYRFFHSAPYLENDPMVSLTEHTPELSAMLGTNLSDSFDLDVNFKMGGLLYAHQSESMQTGLNMSTDKNLYYIEGSPTITIQSDREAKDGPFWFVKMGAGISAHYGSDSRLFFWPKLDASVSFAPTWSLYTNVFGGIIRNGLSDVMEGEMPYLMPNTIVLPTRNAFSANLGLKGSIAEMIRLDFYGRFAKLKGVPFYSAALPQYEDLSEQYRYNVCFLPSYADGSRWRAGAKVEYSYRDIVRLFVDASYGKWSLDGNVTETMQPDFILKTELSVHPITPLNIRIGYMQLNGRLRDSSAGVLEIPNVHLLNAYVSYNFRQNLSAYAKLENVLTETTELVAYYPMKPFHCFVGFNWNF